MVDLKNNIIKTEEMLAEEAQVLVLYTGGTIGMARNKDNVYEPLPNAFVGNLRLYPNFHDKAYFESNVDEWDEDDLLVLPFVQGFKRRVIYTVVEYNPLLDSSNMQMKDYTKIAKDIETFYKEYDGFVILHGTDTLSYTASALSFMLENLGKTVIITGSQIPIFEPRTDGDDNFLAALLIAGNYVIPEVCVYFGVELMRGNRTIKSSVASFAAFESPNYLCLAKSEIDLEVFHRRIFRPNKIEKFTVHTHLDSNVGILRLFPSITSATVRAFCQPPIKGVVLQTFGAGNISSNRQDILNALKEATVSGIIIVNCTQCIRGAVNVLYTTGQMLQDCGVISGHDMTPEAALAKLSYILTLTELSNEDKKKLMLCNLRGELTPSKPPEMQDYDLVDAVARTLQVSFPTEVSQLGSTLFPAMVNRAVIDCDINKLNTLKMYGIDLAAVDCNQRTALHVACAEGNEDVVKYLLLEGAPIHVRDRHNATPLIEAISNDHHEIIKHLVACGSYITHEPTKLGERLCAATARGLVKRLESYRLAGADLSQPEPTGRTALHMAVLLGQEEVIKYLLDQDVDQTTVDLLGCKPIDYAKFSQLPRVNKLFKNNGKK